MPGGGNKRAVYVSHVGFETVSEFGKWGRGLGGPPHVPPLSRLALSTSYINGVVAFVGDLFPAGWAGVRIFEGISEALAAEDMATLCRDDETSILHNLEDTTRPSFTGALVPSSSSQSHRGAQRPVPDHAT